MALDDNDIKQIGELIATAFTEQLPKAMDARLGTFLQQDVVKMVNGAKANTMGTVGEQLTEIKTALEARSNSPAGITAENLEASIKTVLEQVLADDSEGGNNAGNAGGAGGNNAGGEGSPPFDPEAFKQELFAAFSTQHLDPLKKVVDEERDARVAAEQGRQALELKQLEQQRDSDFVRQLVATGKVDPGAGPMALQALVNGNHIKPSENGSSYVVMGKDRYGLEDVAEPATNKLDQLLSVQELQYFRPARGGSGTGARPAAAPATSGNLNGSLTVLDESSLEGMDDRAALDLMAKDPDKLFADLEAINAST